MGAARSGLLIAKHPEDDSRRVLASIKSNLAAPAPSLVFGLSSTESGAVRVDWKGESTLDAAALLSAPTDHEERSALSEAQEFLREFLADGPLPSKDVENEGRGASIEPRTLKRAKQQLGIISERQGGIGERGKWYWRLPTILSVTKGTKPGDGPLSSGADRTDGENAAYISRNNTSALRGPSVEDVKETNGLGPLSESLSSALESGRSATAVEPASRTEAAKLAGVEMRRSKSGPALALKTYLEKPTAERLEWLTKAVLAVRRMDTGNWRRHAPAVKDAAEDADNHPVDCECGECL